MIEILQVVYYSVVAISGFLGGVLFGLWFGERGRRKDIMWYSQLSQRPKDLEKPAEFEFRPDPEDEALRRAEILTVKQGLMDDLKREGRSVDSKEVEEEALRLVNQVHEEMGP